jgi:hypothetical protein
MTLESELGLEAIAFLTLGDLVASHISPNLFLLVEGSIASLYRDSTSFAAVAGKFCCEAFTEVAPEFVAAFYTTAVLRCVEGLVESLFPTHSASTRGVLQVIRVVMTVNKGFAGTEILTLRVWHWSESIGHYPMLSTNPAICEEVDKVLKERVAWKLITKRFMKPPKRFPDIYVAIDFLTTRDDIIRGVVKVDDTTYRVILEHPVFGKTVEIFEHDPADNTLCLRSVFPVEMQTEEEMEIVKDYLNNFILEGNNTYIEYHNPEAGYFLLSRNVGIYPVGNPNPDD